ncbi:MAG: hypothetical protein AAFZ58_06900 [Pseudomonadota bacterium]
MTVFDGYASSRAVLKGSYERAIELALDREKTPIQFLRIVNATSLCVALAKTGEIESAVAACDRAVEQAVDLNVASMRGLGAIRASEVREVVAGNRATLAEIQPTLTADR